MNAQAKIANDRLKLWTHTNISEHRASTVVSYFTTIMEWNDDIAYALTPLKLLSFPLGYWPLQENNIFDLLRYIVSVAGLLWVLSTLSFEIYHTCIDPYAKIDALLIFSCTSLATLKITWFRIYSDNLSSNFNSAINDYLTIDNEEQRVVMRRHAFMGRTICYCVACVSYVATVFYISLPLVIGHSDVQVNGSVVIPNTIYPIPSACTLGSLSMSTSVHVVLFILQSIIMVNISTGNLGGDSLFLAITLHVCGQVQILKIEFENLGVRSSNPNEDFSKMVRRHQHLLHQATLLADTISFVLVIQLLISSVLICIIGFQLILALKVGDIIMITKTIWVQTTLLTQIFAYSYVGDYMKSQMEEIAYAIFNSNWYSFSFKMMRNILFVIARAQDPIQLAAGKFLVVNMETFMSIIKTSLSYLSVLRVMVET